MIKKIGEALAGKRVLEDIDKRAKEREELLCAWEKATCRECREHTQNVTLKDGILRVTMRTHVWLQEAGLMDKKRLIKAVEKETGRTVVKIVFAAGGGKH